MFCDKCGSELSEDLVFCEKCGNRVKQDAPVQAAQASQAVTGPAPAAEGTQGNTIVINKSGGIFQKIMLAVICLVFVLIAVIAVSFFLDRQDEKKGQMAIDEQNRIAAEIREDQEQMRQVYMNFVGSWKVDLMLTDDGWKNPSDSLSNIVGSILDFRNLYEYGSQTNYGGNTLSIQLTSSSVDLTSIGWGVYDINDFTYEMNKYDNPQFTNESQGLKIEFVTAYEQIYIYNQKNDGTWQQILECSKM